MKLTEQIVNPGHNFIFFVANFKVLKMKVNRIEKLRNDGCCN